MEAKVYNLEGKEAGKFEMPAPIFGLKWNADLVHQVVVSMQSNARNAVADTKDRSDVSGGGIKPWRQKGTGRARHGSSRSPIWIGGGVTHGPKSEHNFFKKINKKMKTKALFTILSAKAGDGEIVFLDDMSFKAPKAKEAKATLDNLAKVKGLEKINYKIGRRALIAISKNDTNIKKSFANVKSALVEEVEKINPLDVMKYKYVVFVNPKESTDLLAKRVK